MATEGSAAPGTDPRPLRRLTDEGIERFRAYLAELRDGSTAAPPEALLDDGDASEPMPGDRTVDRRPFDTRLEAGRYLTAVLDGLGSVADDVRLWSWLSLFWFDRVCPARPDGSRAPGRDYRHVLEPGYPYGHRHLLAGALTVYRLYDDDAILLLGTPPHHESTFHHELASRQSLLTNETVVAAVNVLYLDPRTGRAKPGSQDHRRPGSIHRFVALMQQLDLNYDLHSMGILALLGLLPAEFDPWKDALSGVA